MDSDVPSTVLRIRQLTSRGLIVLLLLISAVTVTVAYFSGNGAMICGVASAALLAISAAAVRSNPTGIATRTLVSCCLAIALMLLIYAASPLGEGAVQQAHMMYFITNTFLLLYMCQRSQILYNILVVLHHTVLTFTAPALVWHTERAAATYVNLAVHASIALVEVIPLIFIGRYLLLGELAADTSLKEAHSAIARADASLAEARVATAHADASMKEAHAAADRADAALAEQRRLEIESRGIREQLLGEVRGRLTKAFGQILGSVRSATTTVEAEAQALFESSQEVSHSTEEMLVGTNEMSNNLAAVASAARELAATVLDISGRAAEAARYSSQAYEVVDDASLTITTLSSASREIQGVTKLIGEIASRTHLLALNAAIEAARSGEAGKGFAIVAGEVKQLATQTSEATKVIAALVHSMTSETGRAVEAMTTIRQSVAASDSLVSAIATATSHQRSATDEIANTVNTVASLSEAATEKLRDVKRAISSATSKRDLLTEAATQLAGNIDKVGSEVAQLADTLAA